MIAHRFHSVPTFLLNLRSLASKRFGDNFLAFSEAHHSSEPSNIFDLVTPPWV